MMVTEDLKTVACISSPEHRILIDDPSEIPPLFINAILASEDKNFFTHEGIDKGAIVRALTKRILQESRSGASTLTMQIAKHLRGGTGRPSTEMEKIGDIVMALRIEREFSRPAVAAASTSTCRTSAAGSTASKRPAVPISASPRRNWRFIRRRSSWRSSTSRRFPIARSRRIRCSRRAKQIRDANWAEAARGTTRVLDLMLDQGVITEVEYARAANLVERSLRKEVVPPGTGCGTHDHFLERVRILYKDRFPINKGGLTISITRDDALQDVLAKAVDLTLRTYLARHPDDADNDQLRAGAFAVDFTGDVLAEVGNVNFKQLKYDVIATGWRQPGSTFKIFTYGGLVERLTNEVLAAEPPPGDGRRDRRQGARALHGARCADLRVLSAADAARRRSRTSTPGRSREYRGEISCRIALGESRNTAAMRAGARAGIKNVIDLTYRLGMPRDAKHIAAAVPDNRHRRIRGQSAVDGVDRRLRERRISRDAAIRERCLPRRQVASLQGRRRSREGLRHQGRKSSRRRSGSFIPRCPRR